jgi:antitoxin HicB
MSDHKKQRNPHRGSRLADLLAEDGSYEEVSARAAMRAISENLKEKFRESQITRTDLARRMGTSRSSVNRILDGRADSVNLKTIVRAAAALGVGVRFELTEKARK